MILQPVHIATDVPGTEAQIENSILTLPSSSRGSMGESSLMVCFSDHIPDAHLPDALSTQTLSLAFCRISNERDNAL